MANRQHSLFISILLLTISLVSPAKITLNKNAAEDPKVVAHAAAALISSTGFLIGTAAALTVYLENDQIKTKAAKEAFQAASSLFQSSNYLFNFAFSEGGQKRLLSLQKQQSDNENKLIDKDIGEDFDSIEEVKEKDKTEEEELKLDLLHGYKWTAGKLFPSFKCKKQANFERSKLKRRIALAFKDWAYGLIKEQDEYVNFMKSFPIVKRIAEESKEEKEYSKTVIIAARALLPLNSMIKQSKSLIDQASELEIGLKNQQSLASLDKNWYVIQARKLIEILGEFGITSDDFKKHDYKYAYIQKYRFLIVQHILQMMKSIGQVSEIKDKSTQDVCQNSIDSVDILKTSVSTVEMKLLEAQEQLCKNG